MSDINFSCYMQKIEECDKRIKYLSLELAANCKNQNINYCSKLLEEIDKVNQDIKSVIYYWTESINELKKSDREVYDIYLKNRDEYLRTMNYLNLVLPKIKAV